MYHTIIHSIGLPVVEGDPRHEDRSGCGKLPRSACCQGAEHTNGLERERLEEIPRLRGLDKGSERCGVCGAVHVFLV